jgi:hypothetical protein
MKVYLTKHCNYSNEITFGIFSSWKKAYERAMQVHLYCASLVHIEIWEIDDNEYEQQITIAKRKWIGGSSIRWVDPGYSADVDPTENINQQGGDDE